MKYALALCLFLFLTACSGGDFYSDGIMVIANEYDVSPELFSRTVSIIEKEINDVYPEYGNFDAESFFYSINTVVEYVDYIVYGSSIMGRAKDNMVEVRGGNCWLHNYVMGHELMHVISTFHLGVTREENHLHDIEPMFFIWASINEQPQKITIEYRLAWRVADMCNVWPEFLFEIPTEC